MKYHLSIHLFPYEIDNYQTFIHQLRRNLNYTKDEIIFSPCLNLSHYFYDWDNSTLPSDYFINRFNELNNIVKEKCKIDETISWGEKILGGLSCKVSSLEKYKEEVDAFLWFDSDIIFPDNTIAMLIEGHKLDPHHCIVSPQIVRLWDDTWDVLVNKDYINTPPSYEDYFAFDGYDLYKHKNEDILLIKNQQGFKFAAGGGTLLSSDLFKDYINLTYHFGHYGSADDTFIMGVLDYYKFIKNKNINQYIIQNLVVTENHKHNLNQYNGLIEKKPNTKTKEEFNNDVIKVMDEEYIKIINNTNK